MTAPFIITEGVQTDFCGWQAAMSAGSKKEVSGFMGLTLAAGWSPVGVKKMRGSTSLRRQNRCGYE